MCSVFSSESYQRFRSDELTCTTRARIKKSTQILSFDITESKLVLAVPPKKKVSSRDAQFFSRIFLSFPPFYIFLRRIEAIFTENAIMWMILMNCTFLQWSQPLFVSYDFLIALIKMCNIWIYTNILKLISVFLCDYSRFLFIDFVVNRQNLILPVWDPQRARWNC